LLLSNGSHGVFYRKTRPTSKETLKWVWIKYKILPTK
jgi:hypothetical protein